MTHLVTLQAHVMFTAQENKGCKQPILPEPRNTWEGPSLVSGPGMDDTPWRNRSHGNQYNRAGGLRCLGDSKCPSLLLRVTLNPWPLPAKQDHTHWTVSDHKCNCQFPNWSQAGRNSKSPGFGICFLCLLFDALGT